MIRFQKSVRLEILLAFADEMIKAEVRTMELITETLRKYEEVSRQKEIKGLLQADDSKDWVKDSSLKRKITLSWGKSNTNQ
ncbi:hypothetical protein H5410_020661, partial [Solanum commersonii]